MRYFTLFVIAALTLTASAFAQSAPIVKQVTLTNQTEFIKATKLITPSRDALYRISAYFEVTTNVNDNGEQYHLKIGWTDGTETGTRSKFLAVQDYGHSDQNSTQISFIASDIANKPVGFSVYDDFGMSPPVPFNVYITIEQLQ